ncbi:DUF7118 family protein [Natronobeatus ordinarius]|uniref:DUF7118 family protein n=1 Tax=Natronobeatus ordinarius TaxID=2963433 RepID=UPI0020CE9A1F|nr:hypothetical protein [Natronobeatus ordinarius]
MSESVARPEPVARLERARERLAALEAEIDDHGEQTVEAAAQAYRNAAKLLDDYVDRATGTGRENFAAYVQLEGQFAALVDGLPDDLYRRDAFEAALDAIDKRRLSEDDFERAEAALEPAEAFSRLLADREAAREELEEARKAARLRLRELEAEIADRERTLELATVDLDAPVERLREPIEAYNDAVREAVTDYVASASAREVFALLERSRLYPLVEFERPPEDLRAYVSESPAGESTIPELLEYADYSRSKLDHLVEDADALKRNVATRRTYLTGIDAEPLTIPWPPADAATLRFQVRERRPFVARVADEDVIAILRTIQELTYDPDYDRLQTAAVAIDQLSEDERERLADGRLEDELESLRRERTAIGAALEQDDE